MKSSKLRKFLLAAILSCGMLSIATPSYAAWAWYDGIANGILSALTSPFDAIKNGVLAVANFAQTIADSLAPIISPEETDQVKNVNTLKNFGNSLTIDNGKLKTIFDASVKNAGGMTGAQCQIEISKIPTYVTDTADNNKKIPTDTDQVFQDNVCFTTQAQKDAAQYHIILISNLCQRAALKTDACQDSTTSKTVNVNEIAACNRNRQSVGTFDNTVYRLINQYNRKVPRPITENGKTLKTTCQESIHQQLLTSPEGIAISMGYNLLVQLSKTTRRIYLFLSNPIAFFEGLFEEPINHINNIVANVQHFANSLQELENTMLSGTTGKSTQ